MEKVYCKNCIHLKRICGYGSPVDYCMNTEKKNYLGDTDFNTTKLCLDVNKNNNCTNFIKNKPISKFIKVICIFVLAFWLLGIILTVVLATGFRFLLFPIFVLTPIVFIFGIAFSDIFEEEN